MTTDPSTATLGQAILPPFLPWLGKSAKTLKAKVSLHTATYYHAVIESGTWFQSRNPLKITGWEEVATCGHKHLRVEDAEACLSDLSQRDLQWVLGGHGWIHDQDGQRVIPWEVTSIEAPKEGYFGDTDRSYIWGRLFALAQWIENHDQWHYGTAMVLTFTDRHEVQFRRHPATTYHKIWSHLMSRAISRIAKYDRPTSDALALMLCEINCLFPSVEDALDDSPLGSAVDRGIAHQCMAMNFEIHRVKQAMAEEVMATRT